MAKIDLNRVEMPRQSPQERAKNYKEVALGYSQEEALKEASRCLQCKKRNCTEGCPVGVNIPEFIKALHDDNMPEAVKALKAKNSLPGICGRVCPQESQCEAACTLAKQKAPVAIGRLERYVADWEFANQAKTEKTVIPTSTGKKVAVVGSGPASLTAARIWLNWDTRSLFLKPCMSPAAS
jgi:glutamate synthase (NADPH/NADH) small chain